ncbi:MAG: pantetheine-phosphate adenylyltransferase [Saprospiraceae bacterium]|nr:pantetheine-phosphate adenylyltransferase [Bacteroidia bacterium]MBT8230002.1 pantetheine-phosphate adenylyltransferase [Bacteroidia bacterium]NNF23033.1 pantetheine-phosphate adenylyltransferase [Saprospiraceae bacterium]NNK90420.1 pantetheine-phosphate adenylyltransferase [Saprospiraceae bacterium]
MKIALFPGSFDPITVGHLDILKRAEPLFDKIIVAIGENDQKKYLFTIEQRMAWLQGVFADNDKIEVSTYKGLTVNYAREVKANFLLRGLRNSSDFDYEKTISQLNNIIGEGIETVFLISHPSLSHISSTIVREIIKGKGDVSAFVPELINNDLKNKFYK